MGSPRLPPPPLLEPAWYPDPTGRFEARYWDGRKWTSHISHYGATGADPLLRARMDRVWLRIFGRVILWGALAGVGYWAFDTYWPEDNRDTGAEQELIEAGVLLAADLPADTAWTSSALRAVSPLDAQVDDDGELDLVACADFAGVVADAGDEPRAEVGFDAADGLRSVTNAISIGGNDSFAQDYLEDLRSETVGACLGALWADGQPGVSAEVDSVQKMSEPSFGDEAVWWRLSGTDKTGAFVVQVAVDLVFVRSGRVVTEFAFSGAIEPIGVDIQRGIISVQVARMDELLSALADSGEESPEPTPDPFDSGESPAGDGS